MSTKAEQLALLQKKLSMTKTKTGKAVLEKKIDKLKSEMGSSTKAKKDVTEAKKKVSQMSIAELKKKPEFSFLKGMNKGKIEDDQKRVAKPKGWRFKGKGKYRKPTKAEIVAGKKRGNVYYEARNRRSDVSRIVRLGKGGGVGESKSYLHLYKLTSPNGQYRVEVYDGEAMTPKEALEKMRISLKGLKSYKYVGASSDSANYKKWYDKKSIGYSDTEAWDEVFGSQNYAKGGGVKHSKTLDKKQKALHTGKRVSESGNTYYEYRMNHADNDRRTRLEEGGDLFTGEQHRSETMMAGGKVKISDFKYEIYAENTNTGEKSTVAYVKSYGDIPLMVEGLKKGITTSPIKYGHKSL